MFLFEFSVWNLCHLAVTPTSMLINIYFIAQNTTNNYTVLYIIIFIFSELFYTDCHNAKSLNKQKFKTLFIDEPATIS